MQALRGSVPRHCVCACCVSVVGPSPRPCVCVVFLCVCVCVSVCSVVGPSPPPLCVSCVPSYLVACVSVSRVSAKRVIVRHITTCVCVPVRACRVCVSAPGRCATVCCCVIVLPNAICVCVCVLCYAVGLLGQTYHWIPQSIPLWLGLTFPWLRSFQNKAIPNDRGVELVRCPTFSHCVRHALVRVCVCEFLCCSTGRCVVM